MTKTLLRTVFLAAAVLSADACGNLATASQCTSSLQSDMAKGVSACNVLDGFLTCIGNKLSGCPKSMRDNMEKALKSQTLKAYKELANCQAGSSPTPSGSGPSPSPVPSPAEASSSCAGFDLQSKTMECQKPFMQAAMQGNTCGAWKQLECCLVDSVASCGKSLQDEVKSKIATISETFKQQPMFQTALAGCGASTCAGNPSPAVVKKATAFMADISLEDPRTFDLDKFKAAVEKHTGISGVAGVLKAFEILVHYMVPEAMDLKNLKAAIAKANSVQESQINFAQSGSRRLSAQRLLAAKTTNIVATITVPDADEAANVKASAADVTKLESELGEAVSVSQAPVAIAKVETVLTSDPSVTTDTLASKMADAGADVGGIITVTEVPSSVRSQTSSASSTFGAILAPVVLLMTFMFVM